MPFSGFSDLNPNFSEALQAMMAVRPGIMIGSGYRDPQRQAQLFANAIKKYGSVEAARHWVAPPGHSRHNMGLAADLQFASDEDRAWAHANAEQYGLNFRLGHEPWHIELAGEGNQTLVAKNDQTGATIPVSDGRSLISPQLTTEDTRYPRTHDTPFTISGVSLNNAAAQQVGAIDRYAPIDWNSLATLMSPNRAAASELVKKIRSYA
jgi:hypothetical protein